MQKGIFSVALIFLWLSSTGSALVPVDVKLVPACQYCGMDRAKFAHSRMLVTYDDGTKTGTCSLHCLALDLSIHIDKTPVSIEVADYIQKKLIVAEEANWVVGGNKPGVMTQQGVWAFANKVYAEKFIREFGGTLVPFEEAVKTAYENMYADTKMIREKRRTKTVQEAGPK